MLVSHSEILSSQAANGRQAGDRSHIVPVPVVLNEVSKTFIGIKEQIFVPAVIDAIIRDGSPLESDDFVVGAANLAARAERNQRAVGSEGRVEALQDLEFLGVEDGMAVIADDANRAVHRAHDQRRTAARAVQRFRCRLRLDRGR